MKWFNLRQTVYENYLNPTRGWARRRRTLSPVHSLVGHSPVWMVSVCLKAEIVDAAPTWTCLSTPTPGSTKYKCNGVYTSPLAGRHVGSSSLYNIRLYRRWRSYVASRTRPQKKGKWLLKCYKYSQMIQTQHFFISIVKNKDHSNMNDVLLTAPVNHLYWQFNLTVDL